jgi:hypothetical protein
MAPLPDPWPPFPCCQLSGADPGRFGLHSLYPLLTVQPVPLAICYICDECRCMPCRHAIPGQDCLLEAFWPPLLLAICEFMLLERKTLQHSSSLQQ